MILLAKRDSTDQVPSENRKRSQETEMLSPHEFATLMLLKDDAPDPLSLDREDLEALLEKQLITLEQLTSGQQRPLITDNGHLFLKAAARILDCD
jgi:hypothetical protein